MSEEEKKAIEQFKEINLEDCSCEKCLYQEIEECHGCPTMIKEILLNLIEKQDKMIDYMADDIMLESNMFSDFDMCENEKENCAYDCKISCTDKIKEYFRKRVEEDAKN